MDKLNSYMVQYGVWPNCCNSCDFCLRKARTPISKEQQIYVLDFIAQNIKHIDWKKRYSAGISLLGGELYYIEDKDVQKHFLDLVDAIIENILLVSDNPACRYSTVTNGIYNPKFLYEVIDKIVDAVGIHKVDLNFSFDLKYRYKSDKDKQTVIDNINAFHERYDYAVGVQMILTQFVIDLWKSNQFDINDFMINHFPENNLCFLYPHSIQTGKKLDDFFFKRKDFLRFLEYMKNRNYDIYRSFMLSTKHSSLFKYTGYKFRDSKDVSQQPILCDNKEVLDERCGHSILYRCYSDTDKCMYCDLQNFDELLLK